MIEIRHNFCINTRVRKAEVFFLKKTKEQKQVLPMIQPFIQKRPQEQSKMFSLEEKDSLVRKDFPTSCHCVSFMLADPSLGVAWLRAKE